jgi:hypothetical protein
VHEPLTRHVQCKPATLVEHPIVRGDVKHGPGQCFIEAAASHQRRATIRLGALRLQRFRSQVRNWAGVGVWIDAEPGLHHG